MVYNSDVYKPIGVNMQRTQIYFEQNTLQDLKVIANDLNISVSEFIRKVIKKELKAQKEKSLSNFLQEMQPIESFKDIDTDEYVRASRSKSRLLND